MKVHFITSRGSLENDVTTLRAVTKFIKDSGHILASDWIDIALERLRGDSLDADWKSIYKTNLENIAETDVVIAEVSHENFGVGYQVAAAVQQKKPVLLLRHTSVGKDAFVTGVEEGWVQYKEYSERTLESILSKFLEENDISTKDMRFNFFIDRPIYNYLRWASFKTGKTKAEILRSLVQQEIEKKDL
jgi:hypothetical protein